MPQFHHQLCAMTINILGQKHAVCSKKQKRKASNREDNSGMFWEFWNVQVKKDPGQNSTLELSKSQGYECHLTLKLDKIYNCAVCCSNQCFIDGEPLKGVAPLMLNWVSQNGRWNTGHQEQQTERITRSLWFNLLWEGIYNLSSALPLLVLWHTVALKTVPQLSIQNWIVPLFSN